MSSNVDLRELAIDRGGTDLPRVRTRRHVLSRYVTPFVLLFGFLSLVVWASWEVVFPPRAVTVIPVISTTAEVRQAGTPLFKAAGWVEPRPTPVRVAALAPGVVEQLLVVEDQPVKKNEAIAELVKDDAKLAHERALADLKLREAELAEEKAALAAAETRFKQPVHLEATLGAGEASLAKIETELQNLPYVTRRADADYEATRRVYESKLAAKGVVAGVDIDVAKSKMESAKALVEELRDRAETLQKQEKALIQRRDALKTQLELLADEIKAKDEAYARLLAAQARVALAKVVVAEAKLRLDRMTVRAPIDGRVFRLVAHPGARIGSGLTQMSGFDGSTVVTMYDPWQLQIRVDVRFEDIPEVSLKQPVEIDNPALSSPILGDVLFISSEADIQKNTLQVKVAISDPPPVFKPEMLVDVTFLAPEQSERTSPPSKELRLYVPQQFLHQNEDSSFVWLADQSEGVARTVQVETGVIGNNGLVEITSGLTIGSRIISSGSDELKDGERIIVTNEDLTTGTSSSKKSDSGFDTMNRLPVGDNQ
ncbi:MAG: efflux RND transporter periplasmic adaptor subunit [Bythopirellula sp.]